MSLFHLTEINFLILVSYCSWISDLVSPEISQVLCVCVFSICPDDSSLDLFSVAVFRSEGSTIEPSTDSGF